MLVYADMINGDLLTDTDDDDKSKIKKNEVIHVPSNVKKLCFPSMTFIKNINWDTNCIVDNLGPPGFFSYYNLTQISIPKLVKKIPSKLFEHCHYLKSVYFEKDSLLEEIGDFSFANTCISKIILPKTLRKIGKNAFCDNPSLQEVVFDGEIIDDDAFSNTGIKSFKLSNNTTKIGSNAFQYCRSLTEFDIDIDESNLSEIGQYAFQETSLNEIKIPSKIKVIKKFTFNGCNNLKEVVFSSESELISIESHSFSGNLSLEKINLPKTIKKLSLNAFINTPSLQSIMNESNQYFNVMDNQAVYRKDWSLIFVPRKLNNFEINEKCSIIHSGSFCGPNLNQVLFPVNSLLKTISKLSFAHCTGLKEITIPNSVLKLGNECFIGCQNLEKVEFEPHSKIKVISKYCFAFSGLRIIDLPESIIKIDNSSFLLCQNLEYIDLFNTNINYIGHCAFSETNINEVKFPSSLEFIGNNAFGGNKNLKKIDFSEFDEIKEKKFKTRNQYNSLLLTKYFSNDNDNKVDETVNNSKCIENLCENSIDKNSDESSMNENSDSNSMNDNLSENSEIEETITENNSSFIEQDELENNDSNNKEILESKLICYVHKNAFCNSIVKCFKFNLNHFEWFIFFEKCKNVEEYIVNDDIQLNLQKTSKKNKSECIARQLYKITKIKWENQEEIPILREQLLTEFSISKMTQFLYPYHFSCCIKLTTINFEEGIKIKKIPENCFSNTPLKKITIPSSVIVIENSAFYGCTELEEINFSNENRLKSIEKNAFCKCFKLTKIKIPENLKIISMNCFSFTGLKRIEIPSSVQIIDKMAFFNCKELSQIVLNDGIEEIKDLSFAFNVSLESVDFPDSLKIIHLKSFYKCTNLKNAKTTENTNLIEIHDSAFEMTQIEEICINKNATKLFDPKNMTNLKKIVFYKGKPTNFIQLDDGTIYEKYNKFERFNRNEIDEEKLNKNLLTKILASNSYCSLNYNEIKLMNVNDLKGNYSKDAFEIMLQKNRSRFSEDELKQHPILRLLFVPKNLNVLKIHEDCFAISQYVIQNFDNFTSIEYAKSATNFVFNFTGIGYQMTQKLTTIKILGDYSYLNKNCFAHFESLKSVEFGPKTEVLLIPENAFYGCKKLQQIFIPSSCISIEEGAFKDCKSLSLVKFGTNESPSKLKYIRKESFYNCSSLESIEIPSTVLIICESAFMNCIKLQKVDIVDNGLEFVSKNAFRNCTSLTSFKLPKTCIILGPLSFMNCTKLEKFEYEGEYLKSIQCRSFYNCCSLKGIKIVNLSYKSNYKGTYSDIEIESPIDKSFFTIEAEAFMNCSSLTEFIIEDKSRKISTLKFDKNQQPLFLEPIHYLFETAVFPKYDNKLYAKYSIQNLFQTIQKKAFYNCKSLKFVRLFLGNLESFHNEAFGNCSSLKIIEINSQYFLYLISDGFDAKAFSGTPDDLEMKLFNNEECIKTMLIESCNEFKNLNQENSEKRHFASEKDHIWNVYGILDKKK